ncbi:hypothetical protein [Streptomyces sp. NPDC055506]
MALFTAVLVYLWQSTNRGQLKTKQILAMVVLSYGAFWLLGPWIVDRLGRLVSRFARRPATLRSPPAGSATTHAPPGTPSVG